MMEALLTKKPFYVNNVLQAVKVKMFIHKDPEAVEAMVNNWLHENNVDVQHIGQSQSEKNGNFVFILSLFYSKKG